VFNFTDYANTTSPKLMDYNWSYVQHASSNKDTIIGSISAFDNTAITRFDLILSAGSFTGGTYVLYGVN
jgi:hypothetical protein